jgi:tetratricopeptide (TPR) repeat protein
MLRQKFMAVVAAALAPLAFAQPERELSLDPDAGWTQTHAPEPGTDEWTIFEARRLLAEGRAETARGMLTPWINRYRKPGHPLMSKALLTRGDCRVAMGDEYLALFDYEEIALIFPETPEFIDAAGRELDIAVRYANGLRRRVFFGLVRVGRSSGTAEELFMRVHERLPGSELGERAIIELADHYFRRQEWESAAVAYEMFMVNYPRSVHAPRAMQRRIVANTATYKGPRYDGSGLVEATSLIENYRDRFPLEAHEAGFTESLLARLDESAGAQMLETADWYLARGDLPAARLQLRRLVTKHSRTVAADRARTLLRERGWEEAPPATPEAAPEGPVAPEAAPGAEPQDTPGGES